MRTTLPTLHERGLLRQETANVTYLTPLALHAHPRLRCAFTTRQAGASGHALNMSFDKGERGHVATQRQQVLHAMGLAHAPLCTVRQVHGNAVCVVDAVLLQRGLAGIEADALVTTLPDVALGMLIADCLPVVLYALETPVVAVVHAGRLGTYHRVVQETLAVLTQRCGVPATQIHAVLGPAIGVCCYTLDDRAILPFQTAFADWSAYCLPQQPGRWSLDLLTANTMQLRATGVPAAHIETASVCTACYNHELYSHRAEGQAAGRTMAIAALTSSGGIGRRETHFLA